MSAFGMEMEQGRIAEAFKAGLNPYLINQSVDDQLRSLVAERTQTVHPFTLAVDGASVTARGFEHRGDLDNTYARSIAEAADEQRAERFALENQGYEKAKEKFFELPLYSTVVLMSPPPEVAIEGYPGYNLMYFYHILPGETDSKRTIKSLSFINKFDKDEQVEILKAIDPELEVEATERSILLSPAAVVGQDGAESFRRIWEKVGEVYKRSDRDFAYMPTSLAERFILEGDELWGDRNRDLAVVIEEVSKLITAGATPDQIKDEWKIMLNLADRGLLHQDFSDVPSVIDSVPIPNAATIFARNQHLAREAVRVVATSCGKSGDIESVLNHLAPLQDNTVRDQLNPLAKLDSNSPIQTKTFTAENAKDDPNLCRCGDKAAHFHCGGKKEGGGKCTKEITVGLGIKECPSCGNGAKC